MSISESETEGRAVALITVYQKFLTKNKIPFDPCVLFGAKFGEVNLFHKQGNNCVQRLS